MDPNVQLYKHIDLLLARVEGMQQAVAQLYVELQALRGGLPESPAPPTEGEGGIPFAVPAAYFGLRPVDRRTSPRRQVNQVLIGISSALDDSKPFTGWVLDYSAAGLGLFVDKKIALGAYLRIRPSQIAESTPWREAQVKNCHPYLDGWRLGCKLDEPFTPEALKQFGLE